jgi:hypothetical protein
MPSSDSNAGMPQGALGKHLNAGHTRPSPAVPRRFPRVFRTAGHTASGSWGGDCALAGGDRGGKRPRFRSTSSAVRRVVMTATTRRLPPQGHCQTSASKVLRCKEAQSSRGRLGLSASRTDPAPLPGKGAVATPSFFRALTTRARSFAFGATRTAARSTGWSTAIGATNRRPGGHLVGGHGWPDHLPRARECGVLLPSAQLRLAPVPWSARGWARVSARRGNRMPRPLRLQGFACLLPLVLACGGPSGTNPDAGIADASDDAGSQGSHKKHEEALAQGSYLLRFTRESPCAPGPDGILIHFDQKYLRTSGDCGGGELVEVREEDVRPGFGARGHGGGIYAFRGSLGSLDAAKATEVRRYFYALCWADGDTSPRIDVRYAVVQGVRPAEEGGGLYGADLESSYHQDGYINESSSSATDESDGTTRRWRTLGRTLEVWEDQGNAVTGFPGRIFDNADPASTTTPITCLTERTPPP